MIKIKIYSTAKGKKPFIEWLEDLDTKISSIVQTRINRVILGNFGDCKTIKNGEGIHELRIDYGAGYRIYYGMEEKVIVILLVGGSKKSQAKDIAKAKEYWLEYKGKK
jgi:putative addiction module killer protein